MNNNLGIETYFCAVMDDFSSAPFSSTLDQSDFSTGYLEDALVEFSERSKRRRMLMFKDDEIRDSGSAVVSKVLNRMICVWLDSVLHAS